MESHLLQMRGLKHHTFCFYWFRRGSHLLQMRGLKLNLERYLMACISRIFYRCVD